MSDSVWPHRWQLTRLPHPWDSPGKSTGVGCHFLLQYMKVKSESKVAQSCLTQPPHGLQPTRLLHPWDFPGKSTGVGCHCLLHQIAWVPVNFHRVSVTEVSSVGLSTSLQHRHLLWSLWPCLLQYSMTFSAPLGIWLSVQKVGLTIPVFR